MTLRARGPPSRRVATAAAASPAASRRCAATTPRRTAALRTDKARRGTRAVSPSCIGTRHARSPIRPATRRHARPAREAPRCVWQPTQTAAPFPTARVGRSTAARARRPRPAAVAARRISADAPSRRARSAIKAIRAGPSRTAAAER
jgi:hypothetical protein